MRVVPPAVIHVSRELLDAHVLGLDLAATGPDTDGGEDMVCIQLQQAVAVKMPRV